MIQILRKALRHIFYSPTRAVKNDRWVKAGKSHFGRSFRIDYRVPRCSPSMDIGNDCILQNDNIFESEEGFIKIGDGTFINAGTRLISRSSITIGKNVTIAWGCVVYDHDSHSLNYLDRIQDIRQQLMDWPSGNVIANKSWESVNSKPIRIEDYAWLGFDVVILKGVTVGEGAIVGARSVVTKDIPAWSVAVGNPARVIKYLPQGVNIVS